MNPREEDPNIQSTDDEIEHLPNPTPETQGSTDAITSKVRELPPLKSSIFTKHFEKVTLPSGEMRAKCKHCNASYKFQAGGGYGSLKRHVETKHPTEYGLDRSQTQLSRFSSTSGSTDSGLFLYSDNKLRESLAKFVSVEHLSFSFGSKCTFEDFCKESLNPCAKRVPRTTLTRTIKKLVKQGKKNLIDEFSKLDNKVSLCSDIWSDHWQTHSYMGVTCHWIDNSWNLQKRLLAYRVFDESHNAHNIAQLLCLILEEYGLTHKIFSISLDNASSNTACIDDLKFVCQPIIGGLFFHIRCVCHVLNLCVQDGLKILESYIKPIRIAISYLWSHPSIMKQWGRFCKINGMRPKKFPRDVPTRWNSTYQLLQDSFQYKELLCSFFAQNTNANIYLFSQQWNICSSICEILKVFNDATEQLSGVYYPTAQLVLENFSNIVLVLNEHINNECLSPCILTMQIKCEKYFYFIPEIYLIAFALDPRFKLEVLQEMLTLYYDALIPIKDSSSPDPANIIYNVRIYLYDIYNQYYAKYGTQINISEIQQTTSSNLKLTKAQLLLKERTKRPRGSSSSTQELENYFTTSFDFNEADSENFDILKWWSQKAQSFPVLSVIAKEILACPVSTVAVEQTFSAGGNILDERRSTLSPDSLEAQALLDDWTRAEKRIQGMQLSDDEVEDFDTEGTNTTGTGNGSE